LGIERRQGDRLIDEVEAIDRVPIDETKARRIGVEISAAGEGRGERHAGAREGGGDPVGCLVLADIVRFETRGDHAVAASGFQGFDIGSGQDAALLQGARARFYAVSEDGAFGFGERNGAKFHAASRSLSRSARKTEVTWPKIATAISAGEM